MLPVKHRSGRTRCNKHRAGLTTTLTRSQRNGYADSTPRGNLLSHPRFACRLDCSPPVTQPRRGRLPRGVAAIKAAAWLRVGVLLAEVISSRKRANAGIRVRIMGFDPDESYCWLVKSLGRPIRCSDRQLAEAWFKDEQLRRVWTDLTANEHIQFRLRRGVS